MVFHKGSISRKFGLLRRASTRDLSSSQDIKEDLGSKKSVDLPPQCSVCRNHEWPREESNIYETNARLLEESATNGCQLCGVLWSGINQLIPSVGEEPKPEHGEHYIRFWPGKHSPLRLRVGAPDEHPKLEYFTIEGMDLESPSIFPIFSVSYVDLKRCTGTTVGLWTSKATFFSLRI